MTAATNSNLTGLAYEFHNTQILAYVGGNNHVYQLSWQNGTWSQFDIFNEIQTNHHVMPPFPKPGIGGPRGGSPLAAFAFEVYHAAYVVYIDLNNRIQELQFAGDWSLIDVFPNQTSDTAPRADSPLAAFSWEKQKSTHIIYISHDGHDGQHGHVRELYWVWPGTRGWQMNDLSIHTGAMLPKQGSPLAGYTFENQGTEHVIYIAQDNSIRELYYSGGQWSSNDLSTTPGYVSPAANSPLACYVCEYENTQHVVYIGGDGDVHELYWSNGWKHNDLTQMTGAPQPAANSALAGYAAEYEKTEHVIYIGNDGDIQELYYSGNAWQVTDLSVSAGSGATAPTAGTPLAGYAFENQGTEHVIYIDINHQVHELYRSGNNWFAGEVSN